MSVDVFVKDIAELRHFVSSVEQFSEEYLMQLSRIFQTVQEAQGDVDRYIGILQDRLDEAEAELKNAEQVLRDYIDSFKDAKDQNGKPLRPNEAYVRELKENIARAKEKVYKASRRLREGKELAESVKQKLIAILNSIHTARCAVSERSANVCSSVNKAADRIEKYAHS